MNEQSGAMFINKDEQGMIWKGKGMPFPEMSFETIEINEYKRVIT